MIKSGQDVYNALDLMDNSEVLEELKFGIGDGNLQYYVYNWKCPEMPSNKVCFLIHTKKGLFKYDSII
jgi:glycylpeptide N-tetradecanoyltransferase